MNNDGEARFAVTPSFVLPHMVIIFNIDINYPTAPSKGSL